MIEQKNFPKAVEYFDKSLAYRPEIVESLRGKAESLADLGRFSESQETFERLLDLAPDHFLATLGLGRVLLIEGHVERGIRKLERAAVLEPSMTQPHRFLAAHYEQRGQLIRARAAYLALLARDPADSGAPQRAAQLQAPIEGCARDADR